MMNARNATGLSPMNRFLKLESRVSKGAGSSTRRAFAMVALATAASLSSNAKADVNWDPTGTNSTAGGGNGIWDTTSSLWYNSTTSTDTAYDTSSTNTNTIFGGPAGSYNVSFNTTSPQSITVPGNLVFNGANSTTYNVIAPVVNSNATSVVLNLTSAAPTITVNGTAFGYNTSASAAPYTQQGSSNAGFVFIGNTAVTGNNANVPNPVLGVVLNGSNGLTINGGGEVIIANQLLLSGNINVSGGSTLTLGNRLLPFGNGASSTPTNYLYSFLSKGNGINLSNGTLQLAFGFSETGTTTNDEFSMGTISIHGNSAIELSRINTVASSSVFFASSPLAVYAGANLNGFQGAATQGSASYIGFASTQIVDDGTGNAVTLNATENPNGLQIEDYRLGSLTDTGGNPINFLSGGNSTIAGGYFNTSNGSYTAGSITGNWTIGNSAGTAGASVQVFTSANHVGAITSGTILVNPYSQLTIGGQGVQTYTPGTITIYGYGNTVYNASTGVLGNGGQLSGSVSANGNTVLPGALTFSNSTNIAGGTAVSDFLESNISLGSITSNAATIGNSNYIEVAGGTGAIGAQIDGNITQLTGPSSITKVDGGTLYLNGSQNVWTGGTYIYQGVINVSSTSSLGTYATTSASPASAFGPLKLVGLANNSSSSLIVNSALSVGSLSSAINISSGTTTNTINLNGSGTSLNVVQSSPGTFGPATPASTTLTSTITGAGSLSLDARSTATLTLSGTNNYSGGTNVAGGTLLVTNITGSATGTGAVNVSGGALGGSGIITGTVTLTNATALPGVGTTVASHVVGTLNLAGGATFNNSNAAFYLNTNTSSDLVTTAGNSLTFQGTTTLNLYNLGALATGQYQLFTFSDGSAPDKSSFSIASSPVGFTYNISTTSTAVDLNVVAQILQWNHSGNGTWDLSSANWNSGTGSNVAFVNNTGAQFDDLSGGSSAAITLNSVVSPSQTIFANNTKSYTISGSGAINGSGNLIVSGSGMTTLSLTGGNGFVGNVVIDGGGTLVASTNSQLGNTSNSILFTTPAGSATYSTLQFSSGTTTARGISLAGLGGAIDVPAGMTTTLAGPISGAGGLVQTDSGTLQLSNGSNSYQGATNVTNGTLSLQASGALPASSALQLAAGATLLTNSFVNSASALSGAGNISFGSAASSLNISGSSTTTFSGSISGPGSLTLAGAQTVTLSGSNTFTGGLNISGASVTASAASLGSGTVSLSSIANLHLLGNFTGNLSVGANGGQINAPGSTLTIPSISGSPLGYLTVYGGNSTTILNTVNTYNTSGGFTIGKANDGGGNSLAITAADNLGNTGLGVDVTGPTGPSYFIVIGDSSATDATNSLIVGSETTPPTQSGLPATQAGVQIGFNTTGPALSTYLGHQLGNLSLSLSQSITQANSSDSAPGVLLKNGSTLVAYGYSAYAGGSLTIADGATVTWNVPGAGDTLIETSAVRNNGVTNPDFINTVGSGTIVLTSGATSNVNTTQAVGGWNVSMGSTGGTVSGSGTYTGAPYTAGQTGALLVAPITGGYGESLNGLGYSKGNSSGVDAPVNLYSGLVGFGADKQDPTSQYLGVTSFRDPINLYGGAIASYGYEYAGNTSSYAIVGNAASGSPVVTANLAGPIAVEGGSTGTVLTYDPLNPQTGARNINFTTDGVGVAGTFSWGPASQLIISSGGTTGGMVSFGRVASTTSGATASVTVSGSGSTYGATLNVGTGSIVNLGFVPGITGVTLGSGIDPLYDLSSGNAVNVVVNGTVNWGGRTAIDWSTGSGSGIKVYQAGQLSINSGGLATLLSNTDPFNSTGGTLASNRSNRTLLITTGLSIDPNGKLNLADNDMIVQGGSLSDITALVKQGFAGGTWNGTGGIVSSAAHADSSHLTAIGVILNADGSGNPLVSNFDGVGGNDANPNTDILLKYTYYGDADLSGTVNSADYTRIDAGFLSQTGSSPLTGWQNGDFNYDGVINGSDYTLIDNAFNTQGASLAAEVATPTAQIAGGSSSAVPEPGSIALLSIAGAALLGRRRNRR